MDADGTRLASGEGGSGGLVGETQWFLCSLLPPMEAVCGVQAGEGSLLVWTDRLTWEPPGRVRGEGRRETLPCAPGPVAPGADREEAREPGCPK